MKKITLFFFFLTLSLITLAQPANDACSGATSLGALPAPSSACPGSGVSLGTALTFTASTVGATTESPYTTIINCETGNTDMASPAIDTWYTFTTSSPANSIQIAITNFPGVNMAVWEGTSCGGLTPRGCALDGTLTVEPVNSGSTFYLQISGNTATATDPNFNVSIQNNFNCNDCFTAGHITATPLPVNGTYQAGQTVNFCFHVDQYNEVSVNWLHGVQLTLGSGWNAATVAASPAAPWGAASQGTWNYYPAGIVSSNTGATWPMGWYFNRKAAPIGGTGTAGDTNPGNNYGDEIGGAAGSICPAADWNFCLNVTANALCTPGSDLSIKFETSADGESGFYSALACTGDPPITFDAKGGCCVPTMTSTPLTCNGVSNGTATATPNGTGPYTYAWTGPAAYSNTQTGVAGASTISGLAAGTYSVTITDATACAQTATVTVTQPTAIVATITPTNPTCTATGSINVTAISGGTSPYDISVDNGATYAFTNVAASGNVTGLAAGTYTVVVRDANGCLKTFAVTTLTSTGSVTASFTPPTAQCLTGNSFSFTSTSTGTITAGTTTYTWAFGDAGTFGPSTTTSTTHTYAAAGTYTVSLTTTTGSCTNTFTATVVVNPMPVAPTLSAVQPTCGANNGQISVTAPLGLTYSLNAAGGPYAGATTFTGLAPGTYTVYVHSATVPACQSSNTITLTNVPGPSSVMLTPVAAHCGQADGSFTIGAVTGGTSGYTYSVNASAFTGTTSYTNLATGTYTVIVKDANGCQYTQNVTVPTVAGPTAQVATPVNSTCGNSNGSVTLGATTGGVGPYTFSFNASAFTATTSYTGLAAGTYNYIVKDNFGCTFAGTVTVANTPGPTAVALTPGNASCGTNNGTVTVGAVTGGTAAYTYNIDGGAFTGTTSYIGLSATTHTVIVKDANGCTFTQTVTVNNSSGPTALAVTPVNATCGGSNGSLTIGATTGGTGPYTYSFNGGAFSGTTSYTGLAAGTYTIVVKDNFGCTFTVNPAISNTTGPTALAVSSTPTACTSNTGVVTIGAVTGGVAPYTYSFNGSGFTATTSYTTVAAGTYNVIVKDNNGCQFTTTVTVTVTPGPTAIVLTPTNSTCGNANGQIAIGAVTGGTAAYTYNLDGGAFSGTTTLTGLTASTHTIIVKDANGCTFTQTVAVANTPGPTALVLTPTNSTCGNANGQIVVGAVTGGTAAYTYSMNAGAFTATTTYTGLTAATYTFVVKDANGCTFTQTVAVANTPGPTAIALTPTNSTCGNANGQVVIGTVTGGTAAYTYSFNASAFTSTTTYTGLAATTYTVVVKDANGCTFTQTVAVANTPGPTALATTTTASTCGATNGTITIGAVTGGTPAYTYSLDGGAFSGTTSLTGLAATTHTVVVKDNNGCLFTVNPVVPNAGAPTVSLVSQTNVSCNGGNNGVATFSAAGGTPGYTYTINTGGSNVTGVFNNLIAGTYTVTGTDANSCSATQTVTITQPTVLASSIVSQTPVSCNGGNNGALNVTGVNGTPGYTYSLNGGAFQASGTFTTLTAASYTVTVKDSKGCTVNQTVIITQPTLLTLVTSTTNANCTAANGTATVIASNATPGYSYSWAPAGGTGSTTIGVIAGTYTVTVTDANLCVKTATATIAVTPGGTSAVSVVSQVTCNGSNNGSLTASTTATAATSYTYSWAPSGGTGQTATGLGPNTYTVTVTDNFGCISTANAVITQPAILTVSLTSVNVSCNGGSDGVINATVAGGTSPYSYSWNPGVATTSSVNGLTAASYTCNVTDGHSCTATANVTISQPTVLAITPVITNSHCGQADGAISVTGTGGAGAYTFSINNGAFQASGAFNGLVAGTYTITIKDANACTKSFPVTVTDVAGATASIPTHTDVLCNGGSTGSATVAVVGGSGSFTYLWSNSQATQTATNLPQGIFTVTVTDQITHCTASAGVTITQPTPLVVNASSTDPLCNNGTNGSAVVAANGGTPFAGNTYTYSWNTLPAQNTATATNLSAGGYNVIVTDANACTATTSVTLNNPLALVASIVTTNLNCFNVCIGSAASSVVNGTAPFLYSWTGGQTTPTASGLCIGGYTVNITDAHGCIATANTTITQPTQLTANITNQVNVDCSGNTNGSATVTAGGATPAYTYSWAPSGGTGSIANGLGVGSYTVTVTDTKTCSVTATVTITEPNPITLTVSGTNLKCYHDNSGTATANFGGGTPGYTFLWQPSLANVFNPTGLPAGTHTVTITDTMGCFKTGTVILTEPAQLAATTDTIHSNCLQSNGYAAVSAAGGTQPYTYLWSNGPTTAINNGIPANLYSVTVTDANLCSVTATANVNDLSAPILNITGHTDISCFGASDGTATATVSGGATPYNSVTWLPTGQTNILNPTGLPPGSNSIKVVDAAGCVSSASVVILEPTQLVTAITSVVPVSCFGGNNGQATMLANGGTPIAGSYNFLWAAGGYITPTVTSFTAGTYTCTVTDNNGCTSTKTVVINQPQPLIVTGTPGGVNVNCNGGNDGTITISVAGGNPSYTYGWTPSVNSLGATLNGPVSTNLAPASYTVTVTDTKGCTAFASYSITEPSALVVTPSSTNSSCGLANGSVQVSVTGGTPNAVAPFYFYNWNTTPSSSASSVTGVAAGSYTCTVTDSHGCNAPGLISVTDQPGPQNVATYATPDKCAGSSDGIVHVNSTGGTAPLTISWTNSSGGSVAIHAPVAINSIDSVTGLPMGLYSVHVADANGCFFNQTTSILQPTPLMVPISQPSTMCAGGLPTQQVVVNASANGGTAPYTFVWSLDGSILAGATTNQVTTNFNNTTISSVTHTYSVTVTDANGCVNTSTPTTVLVFPVIQPTTTPVMGCDGATVTMNASATGGNGGPYTYTWLNTGASGSSENLPLVYLGTAPTPYVSYIKFVVNDLNNCTVTAKDSVPVTVNPNPVASILGVNREGCTDLNVSFAGSAGGAAFPGATYAWNFGDTHTANIQSPSNIYVNNSALVDSFSVQLTVTSALGCINTITNTNYIVVYPKPVAQFVANPSSTTTLYPDVNFINSSLGATAYIWNFGDPASAYNASSLVSPMHSYENSGYYTISMIASNAFGCVDTAMQTLYVEPDYALYVPNAFSPNDDGKNETFFPKGIGINEDKYQLYIFDRWGQMIFQSNKFDTGWDGKANGGGDIAQEDVYVWKIIVFDLMNNKHNLVGHVTLVR